MTTLPALVPYLAVHDAKSALAFYARAFGFVERLRLEAPDGKIAHAEATRGHAVVYLADEYPKTGHVSPKTAAATTFTLSLAVDDVDAAYARALDAGATADRPPEDQFYGERTAHVVDPFGHRWSFHATIEAISAEEMQKRFAKLFAG